MKKAIKLLCFYWYCSYLLTDTINGVLGQAEKCERFYWRCDNGQCIPDEQLCDGESNCADSSDEKSDHCLGVSCPGFSFKCSYGACVSGSSKCNNITDCHDGSDESPILCGTKPGNDIDNKKKCSENEFQCENGQCIPEDGVCDGLQNCADRSDETVKLCSSMVCPSFAFKCAYGACASGNSKCNGIKDCIDGSDESLESCPPTNETKSTTPEPPIEPVAPEENGRKRCMLNINASVIASYESDPTNALHNGAFVQDLHTIVYKCRPGHVLFGHPQIVCLNGEWFSRGQQFPVCTRICPSRILDGVTFTAECTYGKDTIDCSNNIRPETIAKITCSVGYRKPQRENIIDHLICQDTGEWDYHPTSCEPKCGTIEPDATPFASNAEITNIKYVPWHVAIYKYDPAKGPIHQCGGSIISAKLIITAAHCFDSDRHPHLYAVVAGKSLRDFNAVEKLGTQISNVSEISIPKPYLGPDGFFHNDLAILVLNKHLRFKFYIKPICILWLNYDSWEIATNTIGKVAGWGRVGKDEGFSDDLRSIELIVKSKDECVKKVSQVYSQFVNSEKFCVGHEDDDGGSVCQGDSGGGFAVSKQISHNSVYYLQGVLSTSLSAEKCGTDYYVTFTNIQYHKEMIIDYLNKFRPK